jgi:hypothetical protein
MRKALKPISAHRSFRDDADIKTVTAKIECSKMARRCIRGPRHCVAGPVIAAFSSGSASP